MAEIPTDTPPQRPLTDGEQRAIIAAFATQFASKCRQRGFDAILFAETFIAAVALFVEGILSAHDKTRLANRLRELADLIDPPSASTAMKASL
jgi:hypothetical protein